MTANVTITIFQKLFKRFDATNVLRKHGHTSTSSTNKLATTEQPQFLDFIDKVNCYSISSLNELPHANSCMPSEKFCIDCLNGCAAFGDDIEWVRNQIE